MKKIIITILVAGSMIACSNPESSSSDALKDSMTSNADSTAPKDNTTVQEDSTKKENSIKLAKDTITLPALKDSIVATAYLQGMGKHVTMIVPVNSGDSLKAEIIAPDTANIRINQVYTPSGKADGPFTRKLSFPVKEHGSYKIIVGENQMAEGEWKGEFRIKISVR